LVHLRLAETNYRHTSLNTLVIDANPQIARVHAARTLDTEFWTRFMELSLMPQLGDRIRRRIIVTSTSSDSHTWNLVFLQLLLEEAGHAVFNLGACVPDTLLMEEGRAQRPDLIVISSVNGHGYHDGLRVIKLLRGSAELTRVPVIIGGKLGIGGPDPQRNQALLAAGFDAVFEGQADSEDFLAMIKAMPVVVST
jgi:methylaspartate mutase sigma subunit